jgi:hypothetical protein
MQKVILSQMQVIYYHTEAQEWWNSSKHTPKSKPDIVKKFRRQKKKTADNASY